MATQTTDNRRLVKQHLLRHPLQPTVDLKLMLTMVWFANGAWIRVKVNGNVLQDVNGNTDHMLDLVDLFFHDLYDLLDNHKYSNFECMVNYNPNYANGKDAFR